MRIVSVVKLAIILGMLCSVRVLAAGIFVTPSSTDGTHYVTYYAGKGGMAYRSVRDELIEYEVTLKQVGIGNGRSLLEYNFVSARGNTYQRIILDNDIGDGFQKVFIPASKDKQDDYASYVETGWAHKVEYEGLQQEELGTSKKRTLLLSYVDMEGNRHTHHILAYDKDGKRKFISTGSVGNANGMIYGWAHRLTQVIERWPE